MHISSVLFRRKHCKAVSDTGVLCFQFAFVTKKNGWGEGREKGKKTPRILDTINPSLNMHRRPLCMFSTVTGKLFIFTS